MNRQILKKYTGIILLLTFLPLFLFSLNRYLVEARSYVGSIQRDFSRNVYVRRNDSYYVWYNLSRTPAILNLSLYISFAVENNDNIDFFVMSSFQYQQWTNSSLKNGIIEKFRTSNESFIFIPNKDDVYYLVIDNTNYNATKSVNLHTTWTAAMYMINYTDSFEWLRWMGISLFGLTLGSILSRNPLNRMLKGFLSSTTLRSVKAIRDSKDIEFRNKYEVRLFWFVLIVLLVFVIGILLYSFLKSLNYILIDFPEFSSEFIDIHIRLMVFYSLVFFSFSFLLFFWFRLTDFLFDLNLLYGTKFKKMSYNYSLDKRSFQYFLRMQFSQESIFLYGIAVVMLITGLLIVDYSFPLLVGNILVFSIPFNRSAFQSFRKACKELKIKWKSELKKEMPYTLNQIAISIWMIPLFLLFLRLVGLLVIHLAETVSIDTLPASQFQEYFSKELSPQGILVGTIDAATSNIAIFSILFFGLCFIAMYYAMPLFSRKIPIKRKFHLLIVPGVFAILAFILSEIYIRLFLLSYTVKEESSLFVSFVVFVATYLIQRACEEASN